MPVKREVTAGPMELNQSAYIAVRLNHIHSTLIFYTDDCRYPINIFIAICVCAIRSLTRVLVSERMTKYMTARHGAVTAVVNIHLYSTYGASSIRLSTCGVYILPVIH